MESHYLFIVKKAYEMKCFISELVELFLVILFFYKNRSTQRDMEIFRALCSVDLLKILQGGRVQAETVTDHEMLAERAVDNRALLHFLQTSHPQQVFYLCGGKTLQACQHV